MGEWVGFCPLPRVAAEWDAIFELNRYDTLVELNLWKTKIKELNLEEGLRFWI